MLRFLICIKNVCKRACIKVKIILSNKRVQKVLMVCIVALTAYFIGKYRARYNCFKNFRSSTTILASGEEDSQSSSSRWRWWWQKNDDIVNEVTDGELWGMVLDQYYPRPYPLYPEAKWALDIMKYGYPGEENLITRRGYVLSYSNDKRMANWVYEHLTPNKIKEIPELNVNRFAPRVGRILHPYYRATSEDYNDTGYHKRQLASPYNQRHAFAAARETYDMTNFVPQIPIISWTNIENHVRNLLGQYNHIYCCTGTLFLPKAEKDGKLWVKYRLIGKNNIAVPTHFFKMLICEARNGAVDVECYMVANRTDQNTNDPVKKFQVHPEFIERTAGLIFLDTIEENRLRQINGTPNPSYNLSAPEPSIRTEKKEPKESPAEEDLKVDQKIVPLPGPFDDIPPEEMPKPPEPGQDSGQPAEVQVLPLLPMLEPYKTEVPKEVAPLMELEKPPVESFTESAKTPRVPTSASKSCEETQTVPQSQSNAECDVEAPVAPCGGSLLDVVPKEVIQNLSVTSKNLFYHLRHLMFSNKSMTISF